MYTLEESEGVTLTMRPEFTAGFMRAYIQNGMSSWPQPVKLYTIGPAFRRERQQAGATASTANLTAKFWVK